MNNAKQVAKKSLAILSTAAMLLTCGATGVVSTVFPAGITVSAASTNVATQLKVLDEEGNDLGDNPIIYLDTSEAAGENDVYHNVTKKIKVVASNDSGVAVNDTIHSFAENDTDEYVYMSCPTNGQGSITATLSGGRWEYEQDGTRTWSEKGAGTTHLYFTTSSGEVYRSVTIVTLKPAKDMTISEISGNSSITFELNKDNLDNAATTMVIANHKYQFNAELLPGDSTDEVEWYVYEGNYEGKENQIATETNKAEINADGLFTPKMNGTVTVMAKCKPAVTTPRDFNLGPKEYTTINEEGNPETQTIENYQNIPKYIHIIIVKENPAKALKITNAPSGMELNQTCQLKYEATPTYTGAGFETGVTDVFQWVSSNPNVIRVDEKGLITAVGKGDAKITLYGENENVFAEANIRVVTKATSISFPVRTISTRVGNTVEITAQMDPDTADDEIVWTSSDNNVATVRSTVTGEYTNKQTAVITGVSKGVVTIKARAKNSGVEANITCNVEEKVVSSDVILTYEKNGQIITVNEGDTVPVFDQNQIRVSGSLVSEDGASPDDTIVWNVTGNGTNNDEYVDVNSVTTSDIVMTGFSRGSVTIEASSKANPAVKKTFTLKVLKKATQGYLYDAATKSQNYYTTLNVGASIKLAADLRINTNQPYNHDDKVAQWISDNPKSITVDNDGNVKAIKNGYGTVTMITESGYSLSQSFTAFTTSSIVLNNVTISSSGSLPYTTIELDNEMKGETSLSASVYNEKDQSVSDVLLVWSSDNEAVATVSADGLVTARQVGDAKITVKSGSKSDTCIVHVNYPMNDATVSIDDMAYSPKVTAYIPDVKVVSGDPATDVKQLLQKDVDYKMTVKNNTKVGDTATVIIDGIGNYSGHGEYTFNIVPKAINSSDVTIAAISNQGLNDKNSSEGVKPVIKITHDGYRLVQDVDYTVDFSDNTAPGQAYATINGIGNYTESVTVSFKIYCNHTNVQETVMTEATCQHEGLAEVHCDNCNETFQRVLPLTDHAFEAVEVVEPTYLNDGYTWYECMNCGAREKRDYVPALLRIPVSYLDITTENATMVADGTVQLPTISVSFNENTLSENTDYTISYSNKNSKAAGDYTAKLSFKGAYTGTYTVKYTILPQAALITLSSSTAKLKVGESVALSATAVPAKAIGTITWESSDESVAMVTSAGKVFATGVGTATIKAVSGSVTAECDVTVTAAAFNNNSVLMNDELHLGGSTEVYAVATGGKESYQYACYYKAAGTDSWTTVKGYSTTSVFTIKPTAIGNYDVRVKVKDAAGKIATKDFDLVVNAALKNNSSLSATTIMLGEPADIICDATGGTAPYEYEIVYKKSTDKNYVSIRDYAPQRIVRIFPDAVGTYNLKVRAMDDEGTVVVKNLTLNVVKKLTGKATVSAKKLNIGSAVTVKCSAVGGETPYQYKVEYKKSGTSEWTVVSDFSDKAELTITPAEIGYYDIQVTVKDGKERTTYQSFKLQVVQKLSNMSTIKPTKIIVGDSMTVSGKASGGTGNYQYYVGMKKSTDKAYTTVQNYQYNSEVSVMPKTVGTYTVLIKVKDSSGTIVSKKITVKVLAVVVNKSTISAEKITLGGSLTVNTAASGGSSGFTYAVYYKKASANTWTTVQSYKASETVKITPKEAGEYNVLVKAKDAAGRIERKEYSFTVVKKLTNKSTVSTTSAKVNEKVTINCAAIGGEDYYVYAVSYKKESVENWTSIQGYSYCPTVWFTPKAATKYQVRVKVKDAAGTVVAKTFTVTATK